MDRTRSLRIVAVLVGLAAGELSSARPIVAQESAPSGAQSPEAETAAEAFDELPEYVGSAELTRAELEGHVRFLASDELGGRDTGSAGALRAAEYIAREFERAGLAPAGDEGSFFQEVPLERVS